MHSGRRDGCRNTSCRSGGGIGDRSPAIAFDEDYELGGPAGEVGQVLMAHDRLGRRRRGGRAARRTFGGNALALDHEDGLLSPAGALGAVAFDEQAGPTVAEDESERL